MKLIVQIPCLNEETSLPRTLAEIPRVVPGFDEVEILVVDDGSVDGTSAAARLHGADHVIRHNRNQGLARAFRTGLDAALALGADVIVNTDADGQYPGSAIPALTEPILQGRADIVLGDRRPGSLRHFSRTKRLLQRLGSALVARLSGIDTGDAVSGFRAFSRRAARKLNVVSRFSYTIETLIQAGQAGLAVTSVPVDVAPERRPSRLFRSVPQFLLHSGVTMVRTYAMYKPLRVFTALGVTAGAVGLLPIARFLFYFSQGNGSGHVQSLVLGAALVVVGCASLLVGLLADLIAFNRALLEIALERLREPDAVRASDLPSSRRREPINET